MRYIDGFAKSRGEIGLELNPQPPLTGAPIFRMDLGQLPHYI